MKPHLYSCLLAVVVPLFCAPAVVASDRPTVYVIPIKGEIERALVYVIRRGVADAVRSNADAIIFDMNTPGGRVDSTEEIINIITGIKPVTYTFVNPKAISAGAIISMATDHIYMTENGRIGDAMPILMSPLPLGGPQQVPDQVREKIVSPTVALIRSCAQRKGHDPNLAEAMVRPEFEYKIGEKIISPAGQLLTLTSEDAEQPVGEENLPLLSQGTVKNLDELLDRIGMKDAEIKSMGVSSVEHVARFIESWAVSAILLAIGLILIYVEFKTPGFGLPGISGILILAIWFWGHHIAGLAGMAEITLFVIGIILLLVEIFLIPGFGIVGVSGVVFMVTALLLAMVEHYPGGSFYPPAPQLTDAGIILGSALTASFLGITLLAKYLPETTAFRRIMLTSAISSAAGYQASQPSPDLVGLRGSAETDLRPGGIGIFGDKRLSILAQGEFIDKGTPIIIAETHGNRIIVTRI